MNKSTAFTVGDLLLPGLICCGGAFVFLIAFLSFPEQEAKLMRAMLSTAVMIASGIFTMIVYVTTVSAALKRTESERFTIFTLVFLAICTVVGGSLPAPTELQTPLVVSLLLMGLISLGAAAISYRFWNQSDDKHNDRENQLSFRDRYLRW